ncbi:MAG: 23S rRNA (adenine(1618)-N(6))-methyltransferase RlmF [Flavobacteriaceae bacterium]|nr:23S rRNA (adenine(1618)-N(6))-methyltransferase RlmF [Flavobacteriaceae bacterium]
MSKSKLHKRNKHNDRYDLELLTSSYKELAKFVQPNKYGDESIDFFDPKAVMALNKALLKHYYDVSFWEIPEDNLCPPIPGRADYIHYIADLLYDGNEKLTTTSNPNIKCLDIGTGANCVYPIIGVKEYGWSFVASDISPISVRSAKKIVEKNEKLKANVSIKHQSNNKNFFKGIIAKDEMIDISICNPPFHVSAEEAQAGSLRKVNNLKKQNYKEVKLNFAGKGNELWCEGGEKAFVEDMIFESKQFASNCLWFSTLISKQANLKNTYRVLNNVKALDIRTIEMKQGNKISRIVAWTFKTKEEQKQWEKDRF